MLCEYTVIIFLVPNLGLPSTSISGKSQSYRFFTGPVICIM